MERARKHVKVDGDVVRRPLSSWSPAVHGLLRHLEKIGFAGVPRLVGLEGTREVVTWIPGDVGHYPLNDAQWSDDSLVQAARFLRRFHDATASYRPEGAPWRFVYPDHNAHEVICHNDFAPYNMTYVNGRPVGLIDFDTAGPGPRIWDVAYAVYRFVPLVDETDARAVGMTLPRPAQRVELFCDAYGLDERDDLIGTVVRRLEALCEHMQSEADAGNEVHRSHIALGDLDLYRKHIRSLKGPRPLGKRIWNKRPSDG